MKKNFLVFLLAIAALLMCGCDNPGNGNNPGSGDPGNGNNPGSGDNPGTSFKYAAEFCGEWIRMDTGDRWYITRNAITVNDRASNLNVTLLRTSANVVTATAGSAKHTLFAARVANAGFNAQIVLIDEEEQSRSIFGRSSQGSTGQKPPVRVINPKQPDLPPITAEPDSETGEIKVTGVIPGDPVVIIPDDDEWKDINVTVIPSWGEEQNLGTIPLTHGDNYKVSVRMASSSVDINELYADGVSRSYIFEIENIGSTHSGDIGFEVLWDNSDFILTSGAPSQNISNIPPGQKRGITLSFISTPIENIYQNKEFNFRIRNYIASTKTVKTWHDSVSVNYHKASVPFRFRSERGPVQGVIRDYRGKTYYFKTSGSSGNYSATMNIPWSSEEYTIAFLGATIESGSATKYSFAINDQPPSNWASLDQWKFLEDFKPDNEFEASAPVIDLTAGENSFMGYLAGDSIDYYKVKLGSDLSDISICIITFCTNEGEGTTPVAQTANAGTNITLPSNSAFSRTGYSFSGWNTKADGTGTNYNAGLSYTAVTGIVTLYANWEKIIFEMVEIESGNFTRNGHVITLTGFKMSKYQVTQDQYQLVMGSNPSSFSSGPTAGEVQGKRPVENVSWYRAIVFCNSLSMAEELTPAYRINGSTNPSDWGTVPTATWNAVEIVSGSTGYRLPTEAQWEYACRAGSTSTWHFGNNESELRNYAWYSANSNSRTHQVGLKLPNAWGLYDMYGNVWEWCWDWHGNYPNSAQTDPTGAATGSNRVLRGGGWSHSSVSARSDGRFYYWPSYSDNSYGGFRVVLP